jgi:indolepyruvate ferredoxin oxidoreductase alpha subunit
VVTSGVAVAYTSEVVQSLGLWDSLLLYQVLQPFPLHTKFINLLLSECEDILVIEETMAVIEMQLADRYRVKDRLDRVVPRVGELLPEKTQQHVANFAGIETKINSLLSVPGRRPTLCAGCPHRASFFVIK